MRVSSQLIFVISLVQKFPITKMWRRLFKRAFQILQVSVSGASSSLLQSDSGGSGVRGAMERAVEKTKEAAATHAAKNLNPFGDF